MWECLVDQRVSRVFNHHLHKSLSCIPGYVKILWAIREKVTQQWRYAEGVWVPKEEISTTLEQFRTILLLNVEGKMFFSIVAPSTS